jgi:CHAT domain
MTAGLAVASSLGVSDSEIWLGSRAKERELTRLSESSDLAAYRIVHFATHGALAGELKAGAEPGLILTPPDEATPEDDGYLSASEIAGLKLDVCISHPIPPTLQRQDLSRQRDLHCRPEKTEAAYVHWTDVQHDAVEVEEHPLAQLDVRAIVAEKGRLHPD